MTRRLGVWESHVFDTLQVALFTRFVFVSLIVLAGVPRLWALDLVEFKGDETLWLTLAEDLVRGGHIPLAGLRSSQGITAPPHFAYVLAPLVALSRDPAFATGAIALANVAAVFGTVWLAWRGFGRWAAIVTAVLYAVNPWAVFWARKIWQPDLMPPMAVLLFFALERGIVQRRLRWAAATLPIAVFATLVHLSFAVLLPVLVAPATVLLRARRLRLLAIATAAAALVVVPSVIYEIQVGWEDYRDFRYFQSQRSATNPVSLGFALELATGLNAPTVVNVPVENFTSPGPLNVAASLEAVLLAFGVLVAVIRIVRPACGRAQRLRLIGLLVWFGLPIGLTLRHNMLLYPHYFLVAMPAAFLLIGSAAQWAAGWSPRIARRSVLAGILLLTSVTAAVQTRTTVQFFQYVARTNPNCFYGTPLGRTREMADAGAALGRQSESAQLVLETGGIELAYLLRPNFARIELPEQPAPALAAGPSPGVGVRVLGVWISGLSVPDGRPRVAIAWVAGSEVDLGTHLQWQLALGDSPLDVTANGIAHSASDLQGQPVVSMFTLYVPPGLAAATYPLRARLANPTTSQPTLLTLPDGSQATEWTMSRVEAFPAPACASEEVSF